MTLMRWNSTRFSTKPVSQELKMSGKILLLKVQINQYFHNFSPDGGVGGAVATSESSFGIGIGGFRKCRLLDGGGGIGRLDFGIVSIELRILSSDLDNEKIPFAVSELVTFVLDT